MKYRSLSLVFMVVMIIVPLSGRAEHLKGEALRSLVSGKRVYIATPLGGEIPVYYAPDGTVTGSGEAIGLGRWLKPRDSGVWWVSSDQLCQRWRQWYNGKTFCFTAVLVGRSSLEWTRSDGKRGRARIAE